MTTLDESLVVPARRDGIGKLCFRWTDAGAEDVEIVDYH